MMVDERRVMTDLIALLRCTIWRCTDCGQVTENPYLRWNYEGVWCDACHHLPPPEQTDEWYQVSDVLRFLKEEDL